MGVILIVVFCDTHYCRICNPAGLGKLRYSQIITDYFVDIYVKDEDDDEKKGLLAADTP